MLHWTRTRHPTAVRMPWAWEGALISFPKEKDRSPSRGIWDVQHQGGIIWDGAGWGCSASAFSTGSGLPLQAAGPGRPWQRSSHHVLVPVSIPVPVSTTLSLSPTPGPRSSSSPGTTKDMVFYLGCHLLTVDTELLVVICRERRGVTMGLEAEGPHPAPTELQQSSQWGTSSGNSMGNSMGHPMGHIMGNAMRHPTGHPGRHPMGHKMGHTIGHPAGTQWDTQWESQWKLNGNLSGALPKTLSFQKLNPFQ